MNKRLKNNRRKIIKHANEEVLFDADRDNNGKGISLDDMIRMLGEIENEENKS